MRPLNTHLFVQPSNANVSNNFVYAKNAELPGA